MKIGINNIILDKICFFINYDFLQNYKIKTNLKKARFYYYFTFTNSTSKTNQAFGGITPPAPLAP